MMRPSAMERFWAKFDQGQNGCWNWTGATSALGYGRFWFADQMRWAHRVAYELLVGPVPDGHELDHLCRNPSCVNPVHLEPVTHRENVLRGAAPAAILVHATRCKHGHPFDEVNTYVRPKSGTRDCRTCMRDRHQRFLDRKAVAS